MGIFCKNSSSYHEAKSLQKMKISYLYRFKFVIAAATCIAVASVSVAAQSLPELWERLSVSEPSLLAAMAQAQAVAERKNQTSAEFFPQVTATSSTTNNNRNYEVKGATTQQSAEKFNSHAIQLNVTQSLWKPVSRIAHKQAEIASDQAVYQLKAAQHELLGKLVVAWAEAMYANNALQTALTIEAASSRQLLTYERGLRLGLYAMKERDEASAKNQQSIAERYAAESELFVKKTALDQLVGFSPNFGVEKINLQAQKIPFATLPLLSTFASAINDYSPSIKVAERALLVAQEEVRKQQAQYSPTLDLVAGTGRTGQGSGLTPSQPGFKNRLDTVALQLNVSLYSGGNNASKVREAVFLESKASHELDAAKRQALSQARQAWAQLRSTQAKLEVAEQTLVAGLSAEKLADAGIKNGTKTLLDQLQAKQLVETARRDAKRAYYDNVIGMSKLMTATGLIEEDTLRDVEQRLKNPSPFNQIPNIEPSMLEK